MTRLLFGLGRGLMWTGRALGAAGRATIALVGICGVVAALANYTMTQGAGTTFGSLFIGGVHYAQMMICDATTPAQCGAVDASGNQIVKDPAVLAAVQQPIPPQVSNTNVNIGATTGLASAAVTMQSSAVANGNGTTLTVSNYQTALLNVNCSVACSGGTTVNFEGTDSTGTFFSIAALPVTGGAAASSVTNLATTAQYWVPVSGLTTVRARISAYSAGTITVTGQAMFGVNPLASVSVANLPTSWSKWSTANNNSNTALTNTVVAVKSSAAGTFGGYFISNPNASVACMQVFDVATAGAVTLGTTRPNLELCIPANSAANWSDANGVAMANGIQIAATTTASGSTAPATGLDVTVYSK